MSTTTVKADWGTSGQTITCSLAPGGTGLADGAARESTVIDNGTDRFIDILILIKVKSGASGVSNNGVVNVYAYGTVDGGTTYPDNVTGSDAAITLTNPPNLQLIGTINVVASGLTYKKMFSFATAFSGVMPQKWGIVIENKSGHALDTTESNHAKLWQGQYAQQV